MRHVNKAVIYGPGLLGASLLKAMKRNGLARNTGAWARRAEVRLTCQQQDWCDVAYADKIEALDGADLIILCLPVDRIGELVQELAPHLEPGCLVTDVGSTKSLICREAQATLEGSPAQFVGSHPMAGSEKSGLEYATDTLFENRACIVTPLPQSDPSATETLVALWQQLGMEVTTMSPERHDEIVAHISHLPHLLASVLCAQLGTKDSKWRHFSGNGLRDTTRIASGDASLWRSITRHNREEILRAMDGFEAELQHLRAALHNQDFLEVEHILSRGKAFRDNLPTRQD